MPIIIHTRFTALSSDTSSGQLSWGRPTTYSRNDVAYPFNNTWYPIALANAIKQSDILPAQPDIELEFNINLGQSGCFQNKTWYLGLDGNPGANQIDFVTVCLHGLAHGLGIATDTNLANGHPSFNTVSVMEHFLEDGSLGLTWDQMNDAQRMASAIDTGDLFWIGAAASSFGDKPGESGESLGGGLSMFAPNPLQANESVIHLDAAYPNELIRFGYLGVNHNPGLALLMLLDLGWERAKQADLELSASWSQTQVLTGTTFSVDITLSNQGPGSASGLSVQVDLPTSFSVMGSSGPGTFSAVTGIWQPPNLNSGNSAVLTLQLQMGTSGYWTARAQVISAIQADPDSTPNNGYGEDDSFSQQLTAIQNLTNGQLVSNLNLNAGEWRLFQITLPGGLAYFDTNTLGGFGDVDLFVRAGALPSTSQYDAASLNPGNWESVHLLSPSNGTYFLGLHAGLDARDVNLYSEWSSNDLALSIDQISRAGCPQIQIEVLATQNGTPILDASAFQISESGGAFFPPSQVFALGQGHYRLTYTTPILHGGAVYPRVQLSYNSKLASVLGVFHNCTAEGGAIETWVDQAIPVYRGTTVIVPVRVEPIETAFHVNSFEIDMHYDKTWLTYSGLEKSGSLVHAWGQVLANGNEGGHIYIAAANSQMLELEADTDAVLLGLVFAIKPDAPNGACADIGFDRLVYNNGEPLGLTLDGSVCLPSGGGGAPSADLSLRKEGSTSVLTTGQSLNFELTVFNAGPNSASNITVADALPTGSVLQNQTGDGSYNAQTGVWTVGVVHANQQARIQLQVQANQAGAKSNIAEIRTAQPADPDSTPNNQNPAEDDYDAFAYTVNQIVTSDLRLAKSVNLSTPKVGQNVVFSLSLTNDGPDPVGSATVTDFFNEIQPSGLAFVSASGPGSFDPNSGQWVTGGLASGANQQLALTFTVTRIAALTNKAEVTLSSSADPDSTPGNRVSSEDDFAQVSITPQSADLSMTGMASTTAMELGDPVTLSWTVTNNGPDPAASVTAQVTWPSGLTYSGHSGDGTYTSSSGLWSIGSLNASQSATLNVTVSVQRTSPFSVFGEVTGSDQADPDSKPANGPKNEDDEKTLNLDPYLADLSLSLTSDTASPNIGETANLTLTLQNDGPDRAAGVTVSLPMAGPFSYVSDDGGGSYDGMTGLWTVGTLNASSSAVLVVTVQKDSAGYAAFIGEIQTSATADPDSSPGNSVATEDDYAVVGLGAADLSLSSNLTDPEPGLGEQTTFQVTLHNAGPDPVPQVQVRFGQTPGLLLVATSGPGSFDGNSGIWNLTSTLAAGADATYELTYQIFGGAQKDLVAEVYASPFPDPDSIPNNGNPGEDDWTSKTIAPACAGAAVITIQNLDGPGEGFNDTRSAAPVGGNSGTTLGEQRLNAFSYAANIWGAYLTSNVEVVIEAKFDPLTCSSTSAVLGAAGPKTASRDFAGAEYPGTWYPIALANSMHGSDLASGVADVQATFNASIDQNNNCLANTNWYYGLDGMNPPGTIDFVSVLLHELGHGLGFLSFVNGQTGELFMGRKDIYTHYLEDHNTGKKWPQMSNAERAASARNDALHFTGPNLVAQSGGLTTGASPEGHVNIYSPSTYAPGSSVSHFSTVLAPYELMEPFYTGANHDPGLALPLFQDLGWSCQNREDAVIDLALSLHASSSTPAFGQTVQLDWVLRNDGPDSADSAMVDIQLPTGLDYVSHSGAGYTPGTHTWSISNLASGQEVTLSMSATVNLNATLLVYSEVVAASAADSDSTPGNGSTNEDDDAAATLIPTRNPNADLSLNLAVDDMGPAVGDTVQLFVSIQNRGPDGTDNVAVRVDLSADLLFQSADGSYNSGTGVWTVGALAVNQTKTLTLDLQVDAAGPLPIYAEITASDLPDPDSVPNNGSTQEDDDDQLSPYGQPNFPACDRCAMVNIINGDGPGEGFNDATLVAPIGGNSGTTLGDQRLIAFQYAGSLLCQYLKSDTEINVLATFDALMCQSDGAILGSAGPTHVIRDFSGAPLATTWYPVALANALAGGDLNGMDAELVAMFNSRIDETSGSGSSGTCTSSNMNYVVVRDAAYKIKFENAAVGTGENRTYMKDTFVIQVNNGSDSVGVTTKAATSKQTRTLTGAGATQFIGQQGFRITLESIQGSTYTLSVEAVCNYHALSHIEFNFGTGASVVSPTSSYSATRLTCAGRWNPECNENPGGGEACLPQTHWYYGLDGNAGSGIDLVSVVFHEMLHGLGFLSFVDLDPQSSGFGHLLLGYPDPFTRYLTDHPTGLTWSQMSDSERIASAQSVGNLSFSGPETQAATGAYSAGIFEDGQAKMFASQPIAVGSTASHFSPEIAPAEIMAPFYTGTNHRIGLALPVLMDLGWARVGCVDLALQLSVDNANPNLNDPITFSLTAVNQGTQDAHNVEVQIDLPAGFPYQSHSGPGTFSSGTGLWQVGDISASSSVQLDVTVLFSAGNKTLIAEVVAVDEPDPDSIPNNQNPAEDDYVSMTLGSADLSLDLTINNANPLQGSSVTLTVQISNAGPDPASDVEVKLSIPSGLTWISDNGLGDFFPSSGVWLVHSLASGASQSLQIQLRAQSSAALYGEVDHASPNDPDSTPGNQSQNEDDDDQVSVTVQVVSHSLTVEILGVYPVDCPDAQAWVRVLRDGAGLCCLTAGQFTLSEDGVVRPVSLTAGAQAGTYGLSFESLVPDGRLHQLDIRLLDSGDEAYTSAVFTQCDASGCTELQNQVVVPNISGFQNSWRCFYIDVPAHQRLLTFDSFLGSGDADMLVRYGAPPTLQDFDYHLRQSGNDEHIAVNYPTGGTWWVALWGYDDYAQTNLVAAYYPSVPQIQVLQINTANCPQISVRVAVQLDQQPVSGLTAGDFQIREDGLNRGLSMAPGPFSGEYDLTFTTPTPNGATHGLVIGARVQGNWLYAGSQYQNCLPDCMGLQNGQIVSDLTGNTGSWRCFYLDVPSGQDYVFFRTWSGLGDADLYVRFGAEASIGTYDFFLNKAGNEEYIQVATPSAGRWYFAMHGHGPYEQVKTQAQYGTNDLALSLSDVSAIQCPEIAVTAAVLLNGNPVSGLTASNFSIRQRNGSPTTPNAATSLGNGAYRLKFQSAYNDGSTVDFVVGVSTSGKNQSATSQFQNCTRAGAAIPVTINDDNSVPAGSLVLIPVMVDPIDVSQGVTAFSFELTYDPNLLTYLQVATQGSLCQTWDVLDDTATRPGTVRLFATNLAQIPLSSAQESTLIFLQFEVDPLASAGTCSDLDWLAFEWNSGTPPSQTEDGRFCVSGGCVGAVGDVDRDGNAREAFDALQIIKTLLGIPTVYDPIPLCVADTNCSGVVTVYDANLILQRAVRLISGYCLASKSKGGSSVAVSLDPLSLTVEPGQSGFLVLQVDQLPLDPVYGYHFQINFDPNQISLNGVVDQQGTLTERWDPPVLHFSGPGQLRALHLNPYEPMQARGALLKLAFSAGFESGTTELSFPFFTWANQAEDSNNLGPFSLEIDGSLCFDLPTYQGMLSQWPNPVDVLDLIDFISCLNRKR
ncbi:MAG: DUF11 domain-containing protein [Acidobacteria bacterium]|nr:DUF11 domain-containing protein [Acidobacteriota bacterium]